MQIKAIFILADKKYEVPKSAIILAVFSLFLPTISNSSESTSPHIPEPMVFDLVRPLGASKGELEVNTLLQYDFEHDIVDTNPETEYAFADGYAIEFELPVRNTSIAAYKFSLQGTFSYPKSHHFIHGWQYMGEYYVDDERYENTALYLFGYQFNEHWSTLNMAGIRRTELGPRGYFESLLNGSLFYSPSSKVALGIEINWEYKPDPSDETYNTLIMPQVHFRLAKHANLQFGVGMKRVMSRNFVHPAMRLVFTF